ncbi:MAG TPA: hypothetical protein VH280_25145 [Verrucomicrobiae bacterium]|jgi:hypothetical protein|nr:hypothetical protein [Verrucomicrobiae bacterium]
MGHGREILQSRGQGSKSPQGKVLFQTSSEFGILPSKASSTKDISVTTEGFGDWVYRIQAAFAREASDVLELATVLCRARRALSDGRWSQLWQGESTLPFSKRKAEMLVVIGKCVEGLNAQNSAQLPAAWNTLYYIARLGRKMVEELIGQGRIHQGLTLREAIALWAEYVPNNRRATSASKLEARFARFAMFVRKNLEIFSAQDREMVGEQLAALAQEIKASADIAAEPSTRFQLREFLAPANQLDPIC